MERQFKFKIEEPNEFLNLPGDLLFVNSLNIAEMKKKLFEKFTQKGEQTSFQKGISQKEFSDNKQVREYIKEYGIEEKNLHFVYSKLEEQAQKNGVKIEYADFSGFSEDDLYENNFVDPHHKKHDETVRSDGKTLSLEKDLSKGGGIPGRTYDLIHLAYGHMVQWSTTDKNALLTKEESWSLGYRNHEGSPDKVLDLMALYEFEAGMMGVNALQRSLSTINEIPEDQKEKIIQYFTDYVYADSQYIIQHYRGNKSKFEQYFNPGKGVPPIYNELVVPEYIERDTVEIGLIRDKQK